MMGKLRIDRRLMLGGMAAALASPRLALARSAEASYPALRKTIDRYLSEGLAPHMLVAVGRGTWPPEYLVAGTHEIGGGPPVGPQSLYYLASMTKPIVAFAVMSLVEEGALTLDMPLEAIYPAYADLRVLTDPENSLATRPANKSMTIRHLLTHSSGFGVDFNITGPLKDAYLAPNVRPWQRYLLGSEPPPTPSLDEFAAAAASIPLLFEPGSSWRYSMGLDIALAIVEKVSGQPFEKFIQSRLYEPLGMRDTSYSLPSEKRARMTATYQYTPDGLQPRPPEMQNYYEQLWTNPPGGGGLVSSAADYCRFSAMLLNEGTLDGVRVMKPETARLMMSDLMEPGVPAATSYGSAGHGAGGRVTTIDDPSGEGIGTYGWGGASNTMFWVDRTRGVYIVIMTQIAQWYPNPIYPDFRSALYADLAAR